VLDLRRQTIHDWLERGDPNGADPHDEPYRRFRRRVETAQARGEARAVATIAKAATQDWRAQRGCSSARALRSGDAGVGRRPTENWRRRLRRPHPTWGELDQLAARRNRLSTEV
jgi:hypothetical protein